MTKVISSLLILFFVLFIACINEEVITSSFLAPIGVITLFGNGTGTYITHGSNTYGSKDQDCILQIDEFEYEFTSNSILFKNIRYKHRDGLVCTTPLSPWVSVQKNDEYQIIVSNSDYLITKKRTRTHYSNQTNKWIYIK